MMRNYLMVGLMTLVLGVFIGISLNPVGGGKNAPSGIAAEAASELPKQYRVSGKMVMLEFHSASCGACQYMEPYVTRLRAEVEPDVQMTRVNVHDQKNWEIMQKFGVNATPTYILFDQKGKSIYQLMGANPPELRAHVYKALGKTAPADTQAAR